MADDLAHGGAADAEFGHQNPFGWQPVTSAQISGLNEARKRLKHLLCPVDAGERLDFWAVLGCLIGHESPILRRQTRLV